MYITDLKQRLNKLYDFYFDQLKGIRTNKVSSALLDNITVEAYGTKSKLNGLANISIQLPNIIILEIWDFNIINNIVKSLETSTLNIPIQKDNNVIKLVFPPVTEERRLELLKIVNQEREKTHIKIKQIRDEILKSINKDSKDKKISEDEKFGFEKEAQKEIDSFKSKLEELTEKKNKEIKTV